jgi:hypothetical protein
MAFASSRRLVNALPSPALWAWIFAVMDKSSMLENR